MALVAVIALSACSKGGDDAGAGNAAAPAATQVAGTFSPAEKNPPKPERRVPEAQRKAYGDLFSCRFQLHAMETKSMDVDGAFADKVAEELKTDPNAVKTCLATLTGRQAEYKAPGAAAAPAPAAASKI